MKLLKNLTGLLKRSEGLSLIAIVALIVIMAVMGGVFSHIMGRWNLSAPTTMNSSKALCLAETALMFALQDAKYRFYGGSFNYGTSGAPYIVHSSNTEEANYWFERPDLVDDGDSASDSSDSGSDDGSDDDADDASNPTRYTIVATGKVIRDGTTVAKRQIKIKATITQSPSTFLEPGVHTDGGIDGTGPVNNAHFDMDNPDTGANVTYGNGTDNVTSGSESGPPAIVYRPAQPLDENIFKALAADQGHYESGNFAPSDGYPNGSYYFDTPTNTIPNITYVEGDFSISGNKVLYGVYWINGATTVFNGNYQLNGIIISEGDITMNGGGTQTPNLNGGIVQYGAGNKLTGNGSPVDIDVNIGFFDDLNNAIPVITVQSWQEAVSAN